MNTPRTRALALAPALLLLIGGLAAGCGAGPTPERNALPLDSATARETATANVQSALTGLDGAVGALAENTLVERLAQLWLSGGEEAACVEYDPSDMDSPCSEPAEAQTIEDAPDVGQQMAEDITRLLRERVMVDSQLEASEGDVVVYLLDPATACGESESCAAVLDAMSVRVEVRSYADGDVDLRILFDEALLAPATFELHAGRLSVRLDLGVGLTVARDIIAILDAEAQDDLSDRLPEALEGVVELALEIPSPDRAVLVGRVLSTIRVRLPHLGDAEIGVSTLAIDLDGPAQTAIASAHVGRMSLSTPYQVLLGTLAPLECSGSAAPVSLDDPSEPAPYDLECHQVDVPDVTGTISAVLAGLTGTFVLDANGDTLRMTDMGMGPDTSYVALDGQTLISGDVNANAGRTFDLTLGLDAQDDLVLAFAPLYDLKVRLALAAIAQDLGALDRQLPSWTLDDVLSVRLDGATEPTVAANPKAEGMEVISGRLTLSSQAVPNATVTVDAGMCLVPVEEPGSEHTLLGALQAIDCE